MRKLTLWLAKIFKVDITTERVKHRDKKVEKQITLEDIIEGDITVKGNLAVNGTLSGQGEIVCFKAEEE